MVHIRVSFIFFSIGQVESIPKRTYKIHILDLAVSCLKPDCNNVDKSR